MRTNSNCECRVSNGDFVFCPLHAAAPELLEACKAIWNLLEDGSLVRNIEDDGKPEWVIRQIPIMRELAKLPVAIDKAERNKP